MDGPASRTDTLREMLRPWPAKLAFGGPLFATAYQFGCDQFGLPTLPRAWNVTGAAFPWWGWLFIAQTGFVYALFEYVRRNGAAVPTTDPGATVETPERIDQLGHQKLAALIARRDYLKPRHDRALELVKARSVTLQRWWEDAKQKPVGHIMNLESGIPAGFVMELDTLFRELGLAIPEPPFGLGFHDLSRTAYRDSPTVEQLKIDARITRAEYLTIAGHRLLGAKMQEIQAIEDEIAAMGTGA